MRLTSLLAPLWLCGGALISSLCLAQSGMEWLDRLSHSHRELNYHGIFIYEREGAVQTLRIAHGVVDGEEYERLEYLDGKKRHIVRRGHSLDCIHPGHQLVRLYRQRAQQAAPGAGPESFYRFVEAGTERVAGRETLTLLVEPKDIYRFGYRLSFDRDTGLLLRSELLDGNGRVLERFQYAELTVGDVPQKLLQGGGDAYEVRHSEPLPAGSPETGAADMAPAWVPAGFTLAQPVEDIQRNGLTYTDGLAAFSVFMDKAAPGRRNEAVVREGATVAYSRTAGGQAITVVGEIPRLTAERVAGSIQLAGQ